MTQVSRPSSPCVQICRLTPEGDLCEGCGRTLNEIARWARMNASEQEAVWQRLDRDAGATLEYTRPERGKSSDPSR